MGAHGSRLHGRASWPSTAVRLLRDEGGRPSRAASALLASALDTSASAACWILLPRSLWTRPKRAIAGWAGVSVSLAHHTGRVGP